METKTTVIGVLLLIAIITVSVFAYPYISDIPKQTTASISSLFVDSQGSEQNGKWTGSYWNMQVYVTAIEDIVGIVLPENQTTSINVNGVTKALETGAKIEIKIDPGQPYIIRNLQEKTVMVTPDVSRTYSNRYVTNIGEDTSIKVTELDLRYYDWAEPTFRIYTPFTVSIYKDGTLIKSVTLNMEGSNYVQTIDTGQGIVRIENLGGLSGQYLSPSVPSQIAILKGYPNVYDWTQIASLVTYDSGATYTAAPLGLPLKQVSGTSAYSTYWFGNMRWSSNNRPSAIIGTPHDLINDKGGWSVASDGLTDGRNPNKPVISSSDKSSLPEDKRSYYSLIEYIENLKGIQNLAETIFRSGTVFQKVSFVSDINGQTALKMEIPWSAYGVPLVNIRVPTELADTFVEKPAITDTKVSAEWENSGGQTASIMGSSRIKVTLTNQASVTGSSRITIASSNSKLAVTPLEQTVNNLVPNVPQVIYFDATNLGVENQISGIPITITAYETYGGTPTGSAMVYGTLLPTLSTGQTTVTIHAVEKGSSIPVVGVQIQALYPASGSSQNKEAFTDSSGIVTFTLETPQGGAYIGSIYLQSAETSTYRASYMTQNIVAATNYDWTLPVELKGQEYTEDGTDYMLYIILGVAVAITVSVIAAIIYYARRK